MKLNLGCGDDIKKGYVNIDVRNLPGVNIVGDVCNLPFEKNSIDEILALDVYEHVSYLKSQVLLIHWGFTFKTWWIIVYTSSLH